MMHRSLIAATVASASVLTVLQPLAASAQYREAVILRLGDIPDATTVEVLAGIDVRVGQYLGDNGFYASVPAGALDRVRALLDTAIAGATLEPVSQEMKTRTVDAEGAADSNVRVRLNPAVGAGDESIAESLANLPVTVIDPNHREGWVVDVPLGRLPELAADPIIEEVVPARRSPFVR